MTGGDRTGGGIPEFEANMATFEMSNWCWLAVLLGTDKGRGSALLTLSSVQFLKSNE